MLISYKKPRGRFFVVGKPGGQPVTEWTVTVTAGSNGSVSVDGVTGDYSATVPDGTVLEIEATASEHYSFSQWSDGNTSATRTVTVTGDLNLTASFAIDTYMVSIIAGDNGSVSVNSTPGDYIQTVSYGTVLTVEATPSAGYGFTAWSDGSSANPRTVTVTGDVALSAAFAIQTFSVSITAGNNGSVSVDGVTGDYTDTVAYGTQLTVEATPNTGYDFTSWSDGVSTNPRTITVTGPVSLISAYQIQSFNVSVSAGSNGTVSVNGTPGNYSQTVNYGTTLTIEATGNTGYDFTQWSDGDTNATRTITVTGNVTLTASFQVAVDQFKVTNTGSNPSKVVMGIIAETNNTSQRHTFNVTNMSLVSESHELNLEWSTDKTNWTSVAYTYQNFNFANGNFGGSVYVGPELQPGESVYLRNFDAEKLYVEYKNTSTSVYYYAFPGIGMWDTTSRAYSQFSVSGELSTMFKDQSARNRIRMYMELGDCSQLKLDKVYDTWHNSSDTRYDNTHYGTFASMFYGCSAITNPPQITYSQQTTKYGQYYNMFHYCTSLTSAPVFPETTISKKALSYTFSNCSALALIDVNFTTWSTYQSSSSSSLYNTDNWVSSVASSGTFRKPNALSTARGTSQIPNNWTIVYKG